MLSNTFLLRKWNDAAETRTGSIAQRRHSMRIGCVTTKSARRRVPVSFSPPSRAVVYQSQKELWNKSMKDCPCPVTTFTNSQPAQPQHGLFRKESFDMNLEIEKAEKCSGPEV